MGRTAVLVLALLGASTGHALAATYTDSSSFRAALPGPATTLDFESTAAGTLIPSGTSLDGITFTYGLSPEMLNVTDAFDTTSGTNALGLTGGDEALLDGDVVSFGVATPVKAFGLFVITSDPTLAGEIQLVTPVGTVLGSATEETRLGDGGIVYFLGLISDTPFSSATLESANDGEINFAYNVDDVTMAAPEPGTPVSLAAAAALLALTAIRWRRPG